jgi:AcrR family transcriptional regulator
MAVMTQLDDDLDGRHLRRERNREAVVDALLELYNEGNFEPSANEIAERAGSSPRSLFRYFDDVDDLCSEAIRRQEDRVRHLVDIAAGPSASLADRITALIDSRVALFEAIDSVGQVARIRAPFQPLIAAELAQGRTFLRNQVKRLFAAELADLDAAGTTAVLSAIDVLCSFESYRLMRDAQGHSQTGAVAVLQQSLAVLLGHVSVR